MFWLTIFCMILNFAVAALLFEQYGRLRHPVSLILALLNLAFGAFQVGVLLKMGVIS